MSRQILCYRTDTRVDLTAQSPAMRGSGGLNVLQGHGFMDMFRADRPAQKLVPVKDTNLAEIARIIADCHRFADIGGQELG